jgi:L-lysine 6-transaminase
MQIFDEVQAGIGLTGKWWAHQNYGVEPDMIAFGKKTQVCGFLAGSRIDEVEDNVFHVGSRLNSTWGGNLIDMVRFKMNLEIIEDEKLVDHAAKVGDVLLAGLQKCEADFPHLVSNARGKGLMCAFDLPNGQLRDELRGHCYTMGVVALGSGTRSVRFRPPLNISVAEIEEGIGIFRKGLAMMAADVETLVVA